MSCPHLSYSWTVSPLLVSHCNRTTDKPRTCLPLANIPIKHTITTHCIYLLVIAPSKKELLLVLRRLSKEAAIQAVATLHVSTDQKAQPGMGQRRSQIGRHNQEWGREDHRSEGTTKNGAEKITDRKAQPRMGQRRSQIGRHNQEWGREDHRSEGTTKNGAEKITDRKTQPRMGQRRSQIGSPQSSTLAL